MSGAVWQDPDLSLSWGGKHARLNQGLHIRQGLLLRVDMKGKI